MANKQIQKYADMVNLQMAAEAFWQRIQLKFEIIKSRTNGVRLGILH